MSSAHDESVLLVVVSDLDELAESWRQRLDPVSARGIPPHVTVLFPFVPPSLLSTDDLEALNLIFQSISSFEFSVGDVGWFGDDTLYLKPEPTSAFVNLTEHVRRRFPEYLPYEGQFETVVPHLTIGHQSNLNLMTEAEYELRRRPRLLTRADLVTLMVRDHDGPWRQRASFTLAAS